MDKCHFIVYKHELKTLKESIDVNIKLTASLITSMKLKNNAKYSSSVAHTEGILEVLKNYRLIIEDHIMVEEDMELELESSEFEALIRHMEIILAFCGGRKSHKFKNLYNICKEGISDIDMISNICRRMKLSLYISENYPA